METFRIIIQLFFTLFFIIFSTSCAKTSRPKIDKTTAESAEAARELDESANAEARESTPRESNIVPIDGNQESEARNSAEVVNKQHTTPDLITTVNSLLTGDAGIELNFIDLLKNQVTTILNPEHSQGSGSTFNIGQIFNGLPAIGGITGMLEGFLNPGAASQGGLLDILNNPILKGILGQGDQQETKTTNLTADQVDQLKSVMGDFELCEKKMALNSEGQCPQLFGQAIGGFQGENSEDQLIGESKDCQTSFVDFCSSDKLKFDELLQQFIK